MMPGKERYLELVSLTLTPVRVLGCGLISDIIVLSPTLISKTYYEEGVRCCVVLSSPYQDV